MTNELSPRTLQIDAFTLEVLQKPLYPPFAHHRNKCLKNTLKMDQKSIKYRSGDGTKKKNNPKLFVSRFSTENVSKRVPKGGGRKSNFLVFSHSGAFRPQGPPMELPGDSEDQFFKILARFGHSFDSLFDVFGEIRWPDFLKLLQRFVSC